MPALLWSILACPRKSQAAFPDTASIAPPKSALSANIATAAVIAYDGRMRAILPLSRTVFEARLAIGDFKHEHNTATLGPGLPHAAEYAAACRHTQHSVACEIN
jgi:hypothetical protein